MEILSESTPVARKVHYCGFCGEKIVPGQKYYKQTNVYDDTIGDFKCHTECMDLSKALDMYSDLGWDEGLSENAFLDYMYDYLNMKGVSFEPMEHYANVKKCLELINEEDMKIMEEKYGISFKSEMKILNKN